MEIPEEIKAVFYTLALIFIVFLILTLGVKFSQDRDGSNDVSKEIRKELPYKCNFK